MSRRKDSIGIVSSYETLYDSVADVPWQELEAIAGEKFTDDEKEEIRKCANVYASEKAHFSQSVPKADVEYLRSTLVKHATALCKLAERFQPASGGKLSESDSRTMQTLTLLHSTSQISVFEAFHKAASSASLLLATLEAPPLIPQQESRKTPEVEALAEFLREVLVFSTRSAARNTHPNTAMSGRSPGFEFRRWGLTVGGRSTNFAKFAATLLKRGVTGDQIREAWPGDPLKKFRGYSETK